MSDLANRFESIIYAPDLSTDERRSQMLAWAFNNRLEILERLREPVDSGFESEAWRNNPDGPCAA